MTFSDLQKKARLRLLKMHFEAGVGHIGGNLSALDSMLYLHHFVLEKNDHFILAKGHAAGALYITLWSLGKISDSQLKTFHQDKTKLAGHPPFNWIEEIPFATGSLGHGFGLACGLAFGNKLQNKNGRIFCLMSDGEWQEGSNFEALIFLHHQQLKNVTIIIDCNGLQGFGSTKEVSSLDIKRLYNIFSALNFSIDEIDGHSENDLKKLSKNKNQPQIFLMNTTKGKGVSFMENKMQWHYLPLNSKLYRQAKSEIENS
ncbi:MAG: 1-deoxy-D-xylulose-5-phosphate synthase N-terminal domain-containing protein [Rickettsiales bacterium]|nr:1-deoxy-D-xylulose-5-phosphate synthase N-terminal domain-containing protein [Rickettsiales bacterium]